MARRCELCGKGPSTGNTVSRTGTRGFIKKRTKRRFLPNLRMVRVEVGGKIKRMKLCTKCLKAKTKKVEA